MFQIGFDLDSSEQITHWWMDPIKWFLALFDRVVYGLMAVLYDVFFNVADTTIFSSETIKNFYSRVQLIIGVVMIFKLSISVMQTVMDPDRLTNKDTGMGKIITRIVTMLAMFTAIIPLNIPYAEEGSYNAYLNENGLLFGTLYSLQSRIIKGNVIGKLVLGNSNSTTTTKDNLKNDNVDASSQGDQLATFILKTFVRLNLKKSAVDEGAFDSKNELIKSNLMCVGGYDDELKIYTNPDATPGDLLDGVTEWCRLSGDAQENRYSYVYTPVISTVCGIIIDLVLIGYCVDIAVRSLKLAVLRLLAPIPIISYIDPKSSKDGSFATWTKSLTSTYIDVFLRLAIIFFVLFLIQDIIKNGLDIPIGKGVIGAFSTIFIIIGLFYFARMAPKFIKDALGMKGSMSNIGLSGMLAGAGALRTGGNLGDAFRAGRDAADANVMAYNQGKQAPGIGDSYNVGADMMAREITGNDKMTARQMRRGRSKLRSLGLNNAYAESEKGKMYDLQDEASKRKNEYENFVNGKMTAVEEEGLARNFGHLDTATGNYVMNDEERYRAARYLQNSYLNAQSNAGKQEAKYKAIQTEMDRYGGSRNSYRSKYGRENFRNTRLSDLGSTETRQAIRAGGIRETIRNVAAIPGNELEARQRERTAREDSIAGLNNQINVANNDGVNQARDDANNRRRNNP